MDVGVESKTKTGCSQRLSETSYLAAIAVLLASSTAIAADVDNGRRLAQQRCAPCHAISGNQPNQVALSPPFEVIARRPGINPETLAYSLLDPHPKMNVMLTRREAEDIAAYIGSLAK